MAASRSSVPGRAIPQRRYVRRDPLHRRSVRPKTSLHGPGAASLRPPPADQILASGSRKATFTRFELPTILVEEATGPRQTDIRSRCSYSPDTEAEQLEIEERFSRGLYFIGCWHTHPEPVPTPSDFDVRNTSECVRLSRHALNGFVMAIVGQAEIPRSLYVSVCDRAAVHQLTIDDSRAKSDKAA